MRQHQVTLQFAQARRVDERARHRAEAGVEAVDRFAAVEYRLHYRGARVDPGAAVRCERQRRRFAGDSAQLRERDPARRELESHCRVQRSAD